MRAITREEPANEVVVAYIACMWTKLYRHKAYRYLPVTVIIGSILFVPALAAVRVLLNALLNLVPR